jgi:hypothetical protein
MINLIKLLQKKMSGFLEFKYERNNKNRESRFKVYAKITVPSIFLIIYMVTKFSNC